MHPEHIMILFLHRNQTSFTTALQSGVSHNESEISTPSETRPRRRQFNHGVWARRPAVLTSALLAIPLTTALAGIKLHTCHTDRHVILLQPLQVSYNCCNRYKSHITATTAKCEVITSLVTKARIHQVQAHTPKHPSVPTFQCPV